MFVKTAYLVRIAFLATALAVQLPTGAQESGTGAPAVEQRVPHNLSERVAGVNRAYRALGDFVHAVRFPQAEKRAVEILDGELIPECRVLKKLPAEELKEAVLLADAIHWQSAWLSGMMMARHGIHLKETHCGMLEYLVMIRRELQNDERPELRELVKRLEHELGGDEVVSLPDSLIHERWGRDYKTALGFFDDLVRAAEANDTAALPELSEHLDYLLQGGESDVLRVAALAAAYADTRERLVELKRIRNESAPLSDDMQRGLQSFIERLPILHRLCRRTGA